jgi:hypothetical protein
MADVKANAELAYRVLDYIDAHPDTWDQTQWIRQTDCGTAACFAGWACLLSGYEPAWFGSSLADWVHPSGDDSNTYDVEICAAELLGLPYEDQNEALHARLFDESNDREDLGRWVGKIFGPRPDGAS